MKIDTTLVGDLAEAGQTAAHLEGQGYDGAYTFEGFWPLTLALALGIFGSTAGLPVLTAFTTELFPTALRGDAYAWANNLIGRIGHVASPVVLGIAAEAVGWGAAVRTTLRDPDHTVNPVFLFGAGRKPGGGGVTMLAPTSR